MRRWCDVPRLTGDRTLSNVALKPAVAAEVGPAKPLPSSRGAERPNEDEAWAELGLGPTEIAIVQAARVCFETLGAPKTRIEQIAAAAGVSRQTVYKYFSGKADIIDRLGHLEMIKVNAVVRSRLHRDGAFPDRMAEAIALSVEVARDNPYLRRVMQEAELYPRYPDRSVSIYIWQRAQWSGLLERARRAGELADDLDTDRIVHWILLSQMTLLMAPERLPVRDMTLKDYARRFIVEPLLNRSPTPTDASPSQAALRRENLALKELVSQQALELHRLRQGAGAAAGAP